MKGTYDSAFIDGKWVQAQESTPIFNPATGEEITRIPRLEPEDVTRAIDAAATAFTSWKKTTVRERTQLMRRWLELVQENSDELALILTREQGKPLWEAKAEINQTCAYFEWFAEEGRRMYGDTIPANTNDRRLSVIKQPVGVVGIITPWNFPSSMLSRKAGPALVAGCTVVIKPAEETPLSTLALADLAVEAGFPPGVINVVTGSGSKLGAALTSDPRVRKISFTGSTAVGKLLAKQSADTLKRVSLELGGNAPLIVFDDADLELAVKGAVQNKFRNCGQTCVAVNRVYVQRGIAEEFTKRFVEEVEKLRVGNGEEVDVQVGPLINNRAIEEVQSAVSLAVTEGAKVLTGGKVSDGLFFEPTVIHDVNDDMSLVQQEIFGPVAPVSIFDETQEAIDRANSTPYGLAAYFYSTDYRTIVEVSEGLEFGMIGVNESLVATELAPFGGVKDSGYGREGSKYGLDEYLDVKYICLGGLPTP